MTTPFWIALAFFAGWCSGVLAVLWRPRSSKRERALMAYVRAFTAYEYAMTEVIGSDPHEEISDETVKRVEHLKARYEDACADLKGYL